MGAGSDGLAHGLFLVCSNKSLEGKRLLIKPAED